MDPSKLFVSNPNHPLLLQDFITFYPAGTFEQLLSVYLYDLTREITTIVNMQNSNAELADRICRRLPYSELDLGIRSCNYSFTSSQITAPRFHLVDTRPKRLDEVTRWQLITDNKIYDSEKSNPARGLLRSMKLEVEFVLNRTLAALGESRGLTPVRIHNVYIRYSGILGREFMLDLELYSEGAGGGPMEKRVSVLLPHLENVFQIESTEYPTAPDEKVVEFVVPLSGVNERLNEFLQMYEDLCLKKSGNCGLNLVVYGDKDTELIAERLQILKLKYPDAKLKEVIGKGKFSRGRALELGLAQLGNNDLVFICDVDMVIETSFLRRCRRNSIRGKRVYYPEFFKYYNMDYVYRFSKKPWGKSINRQNGHWAMYSYGMLCIFKSDYMLTGGFNPNIEGWGGEDVDLAARVIGKNLDILRAPDPSLLHRYHDKVCSTNLTPRQFASCISSRNEDLADRTKLAEYVFYLEEKCHTRSWKLWS